MSAGDLVSGEIACNCGFDPDRHDGHSLRCAVRTAREVPQPAEAPINAGGPAFPGEKAERFGQSNDRNEGMTLRDYFAAKADGSGMCPHSQYDHDACAEWAMDRADAMLEARAV